MRCGGFDNIMGWVFDSRIQFHKKSLLPYNVMAFSWYSSVTSTYFFFIMMAFT